jgi:hypothetical protein
LRHISSFLPRNISAGWNRRKYILPEIFQLAGTEGSHFYQKYIFQWLEQKGVLFTRNILAVAGNTV